MRNYNFSWYFRNLWCAEAGITLVEVLAATAITAMLSATIAAILLSVMGSSRRLHQETDNYESMRVAAGVFTQDTRYAVWMSCPGDSIELDMNTARTDYVRYKFATWDGDPAGGTPDSQHMHRWVVRGGVLQRDDVVGWNLVPPDGNPGNPETTWFGCNATPYHRVATLHMVKPPLVRQSVGAHLEISGFMR